jgi:hypothetical protein
MNAIRNVSESHVAGLRDEAQRLVDWREHVRAKPLLSFAVAAYLGYASMDKLAGGKKHVRRTRQTDAQEDANANVATTSLASGIMAFVGSMASMALREYALGKIRSLRS